MYVSLLTSICAGWLWPLYRGATARPSLDRSQLKGLLRAITRIVTRQMKIGGLVSTVLLVSGHDSKLRSQTLDAGANKPRSYLCTGVVQQVYTYKRQLTVHHKAIQNYMPEMTMDFEVKNTNELKGVLPGEEISFSLLVLPDDAWIENVRALGFAKVSAAGGDIGNNARELKPGDPWPDEELSADDGHDIHFSDFRGRTVALTFFFTRCPLPDYCPRMNNDFSEARRLLSTSSAQTNYLFLSISFDPDFDTPETLSVYARHYRENDLSPWIFAVASKTALARLPSRLGLLVNRQGAGITHNLRTVVLNPQGRVYCQLDGNTWTPQQLADAMKKAGQQGNTKGTP